MFTGWIDMIKGRVKPSNEFVSADVRVFKDPGSYEMLGRDTTKTPEPTFSPAVTPISPAVKGGRETPDYFGREARYQSPARSFPVPKAPQGATQGVGQAWDPSRTHAAPQYYAGMDPLSMNKI